MIGEAVAEQRIRADLACRSVTFGNAYCLLPDWPGVRYLEYFCLRVEKLVQVGKVNVRPDMIRGQVVDEIKRGEIDSLCDFLPSFNL